MGDRNLSFAASFQSQGKDFDTRVIENRVTTADARVAQELGINVGDPVLFLRRLRIVETDPVLFQESWLNLTPCPGLDHADFTSESAFAAVERCSGMRIRYSKMRYSSRQADAGQAILLDCAEGDPILVLEQTISLENHVAIEWSSSWLRGDQSIAGMSIQSDRALTEVGRVQRISAGNPMLEQVSRTLHVPKLSRGELEVRATKIRRSAIELSRATPGMPLHIGGSFSCAEILAVLLEDVMNTGLGDCSWEDRDRFVLSKGHAAVSLYPALVQAGFLNEDALAHGLVGKEARAHRQPKRDIRAGIELSGGSLGIGPGYAAGLALSQRRRKRPGQVFCLVGDGECNEGAVWEAAAFAGHNELSNLTIIIDANGLQLDGPTNEVLGTGSLAAQFAAFGFDVDEVDGHDVLALRDALSLRTERPRAVIARTIKGYGLSFTAGNVEWHDKVIGEEHYRRALEELETAEEVSTRGI